MGNKCPKCREGILKLSIKDKKFTCLSCKEEFDAVETCGFYRIKL